MTDDLVDRYYRTAHVHGAWHAPSAFVSGKLYHDASDAWRNLQQGILLVWGREDRIVPVVCGEQYRRLLPNATLKVLEGCGHLPPIEQPDVYARLVSDFLGGSIPA